MIGLFRFLVKLLRLILLIYLVAFIFLKVYILIDKSQKNIFSNIRGYGIIKLNETIDKEYAKGTVVILEKYEDQHILNNTNILYSENNTAYFAHIYDINNGTYVIGYEKKSNNETVEVGILPPSIEAVEYMTSERITLAYNILFSWITAIIASLIVFLAPTLTYERYK